MLVEEWAGKRGAGFVDVERGGQIAQTRGGGEDVVNLLEHTVHETLGPLTTFRRRSTRPGRSRSSGAHRGLATCASTIPYLDVEAADAEERSR